MIRGGKKEEKDRVPTTTRTKAKPQAYAPRQKPLTTLGRLCVTTSPSWSTFQTRQAVARLKSAASLSLTTEASPLREKLWKATVESSPLLFKGGLQRQNSKS